MTEPATRCDFCSVPTPETDLRILGCADHYRTTLQSAPQDTVVPGLGRQQTFCGCHGRGIPAEPGRHLVLIEDRGGWAACPTCAALVGAPDRPVPLERAVTETWRLQSTPALGLSGVRDLLTGLHADFWLHRQPERDEAPAQKAAKA